MHRTRATFAQGWQDSVRCFQTEYGTTSIYIQIIFTEGLPRRKEGRKAGESRYSIYLYIHTATSNQFGRSRTWGAEIVTMLAIKACQKWSTQICILKCKRSISPAVLKFSWCYRANTGHRPDCRKSQIGSTSHPLPNWSFRNGYCHASLFWVWIHSKAAPFDPSYPLLATETNVSKSNIGESSAGKPQHGMFTLFVVWALSCCQVFDSNLSKLNHPTQEQKEAADVLIINRFSCWYFLDKPVDKATIDEIIDAVARFAPSGNNSGGQSSRFQSVLRLGSALGSVKTETVGSVKTVRNVQKRWTDSGAGSMVLCRFSKTDRTVSLTFLENSGRDLGLM